MTLHPHDPILDIHGLRSAIYALAAIGALVLTAPLLRAIWRRLRSSKTTQHTAQLPNPSTERSSRE